MTCAMPLIPIVVSVVVMGTPDMLGVVLPAEHTVGCRQPPLIRRAAHWFAKLPLSTDSDDRRRMFIEVVGLQPPHHYQSVIAIQFKKLLTGEPGEVNPLNSIFRGGFTKEQSCYRAKCGKSFHGDVLCFALRTPDGTAPHGRAGNALSLDPARRRALSLLRGVAFLRGVAGISRISPLRLKYAVDSAPVHFRYAAGEINHQPLATQDIRAP